MAGILFYFVFLYMLSAWPIAGVLALWGYNGFAKPFYEKKGKDIRVAKGAFWLFWLLHPFITYFYLPVIFGIGGAEKLLGYLPEPIINIIWILMGRSHGNFLIFDLFVISFISFIPAGSIWYLWEYFWPSTKPLLRLSRYSVSERERLLGELKQLRLQNKISAKEYLEKLEEYERF